MRRVPLRVVALEQSGREVGQIAYAELIGNLVLMPAGGLTLIEMTVPLQIGQAVEAASAALAEEVVLNEEQWSLLLRRMANFRFPMAAEAYREFGRAVAGAERIESIPAASTPRVVA